MPEIETTHHKPSWITKVICLLTIIGMLDAHLALMQTWAWVTMLHDRIPEQGIEKALDTTFSGDYPCEQCRHIAEIKAQEQEKESKQPIAPPTDVESVAKVIACLPSKSLVKIHPPLCLRVPFEVTLTLAPEEAILAVPSPPPQAV